MAKKRSISLIAILTVMVLISVIPVFAADGAAESTGFAGTFWALVPPIIAIGLALITKEVYSSLFIGILAGGLLATSFNPSATMDTIVSDGFMASVSDMAGIFIFLVILGIMVALINKTGGAAAFGKWAQKNVKSRVGAQLATFVLGVLIFVDDYFNCLTVGGVMLPVTDTHKVSRAKLAFIIDATAAPICMIAPISSWAAAVSEYAEGTAFSGIELFIRAIPYNFYSLLTLIFVVATIVMKVDFGPMALHEKNAIEKGDLFTTGESDNRIKEELEVNEKGRVFDLVIPVLLLVFFCVFAIIYSGFQLGATDVVSAFSGTDVYFALPWGALAALVLSIAYLVIRRVISFKEAMVCVPKGFIAMVPAILILTFAWTLGGLTSLLGADVYVAGLLEAAATSGISWITMLLPAMVFAIALGLAFATGTSWGTFGILLPIVVPVLSADFSLLVITISACLAGAVCGDHCSPISDTTIMASTGAQSNHINHVSTQIPYAMVVAGISFVCYILAGFVQNWFIVFPIAVVLLVGILLLIKVMQKKKQ